MLFALMLHLGMEIKFPFDGTRLHVDDGSRKAYDWKGKTYILTRTEMRDIIIEDTLRLDFNHKVNRNKYKGKELEEKFQKFKKKVLNRMAGKTVLDIENDFA